MYVYKSSCPNMKERYDKTILFTRVGSVLYETEKAPFEKISQISLFIEPKKNGLQLIPGDNTTYPTIHTFCYYGIFKPDLAEVLSQVPEEVFVKDFVYISVDLGVPNFIEPVDVICDKDYYKMSFHRGVTTVWSHS
jgi:hypothetical protein